MPDYAALAKQYGAVSSEPAASGGPVDYAALAKQFDGVSEPAAAPSPAPASSGWPATIGDVARGFVKSAAHTVLDLGEMAGNIPNVFNPTMPNLRGSVDELYGKPGLSTNATAAAREATAYRPDNTAEKVGGGLETLAELAVPVGEGTKAVASVIPSAERAAGKFQQVMGAARNIPVDVSAPGSIALRIQELADRGASMPMAVRKFLTHVTDPEKPPMTYEVARDFASNISRLSANEFQRLSPVVAREVAGLRVTLNKAVAEAAGKAGKGAEYAQAMNEYAKAKKLEQAVEDFWTGVKRTAPYAGAAGAGTWLTQKILGALHGQKD